MDDSNDDEPMPVVAARAALLDVAGPVGAMVEAVVGVPDRRLDQALRANFESFVWESFRAANVRIDEAEDEHERLRRLVEWLEQELAGVSERLGQLEESVMAKTLHSSVEAVFKVWREMGDPEMFGYLRAALRSLVTRRDRFRGSLASRLLRCVSTLESDQVEMLRVIWEEEVAGGLTRKTFENAFGPYRSDNLETLKSAGLVTGTLSFKGGRSDGQFLTALGHDLLRFIELVPDEPG